jgi:hypothetical protein
MRALRWCWQGLSGRALRKLPFQAHAFSVRVRPVWGMVVQALVGVRGTTPCAACYPPRVVPARWLQVRGGPPSPHPPRTHTRTTPALPALCCMPQSARCTPEEFATAIGHAVNTEMSNREALDTS